MDSATKTMLNENPLILFSIYTQTQVKVVVELGKELKLLTRNWESGQIKDFPYAYGRFWLWILGAYEVLRTMDQHTKCFCDCKRVDINLMKKRLNKIRVPFAKQELPGNSKNIYAELSVLSFSNGMVFEIQGVKYTSNEIIEETISLLSSFEKHHILSELPLKRPCRE